MPGALPGAAPIRSSSRGRARLRLTLPRCAFPSVSRQPGEEHRAGRPRGAPARRACGAVAAATRAAAMSGTALGVIRRKRVCRRCDRGKSPFGGRWAAKGRPCGLPAPAFLTSVGGQAPGSLDADRQAPDSHARNGRSPIRTRGDLPVQPHRRGRHGPHRQQARRRPLARRASRKASRSMRFPGL